MQGRIAGRTSGVKTVSPGEFSMKVKRFFANVIVLAIFAAVIFFIGWISFYVKPGKCAVMTTKTGGLYPEPIQYGKFLWRWERLLPTNVSLSQFDLKEHSYVQNVSGTLPSAEIYSAFMTPKPDFSYNITVKTVFSVSPEKIHELVKSKSIENSEESLDEYLRQKSLVAANMIAEDFIRNGKKDTLLNATVLSGRQVERILSPRLGEFDGIDPWEELPDSLVECEKHLTLARRMACESIVLLQNKGGILPLEKGRKIALIGPNCDNARMMLGNYAGEPEKASSLKDAMEKVLPGLTCFNACGLMDSGFRPEGWEEAFTFAPRMDDGEILRRLEGIDTVVFAGGISYCLEAEEEKIDVKLI